MTLDEVLKIIDTGLVKEEKYYSILSWYRSNGSGHWLGLIGVDGTGDLYCFIENYFQGPKIEHKFYIINEYYREMNRSKKDFNMKIKKLN